MFYDEDKLLIESFHVSSGHCESTVKSYKTVFKKYCEFHNMSLSELLSEAIYEQEHSISNNNLSIYNRINSFKEYLIENHVGNTVKNSLAKIKTFYHYNRVVVPFMPPLNYNIIRQNDVISFDDLLTKDEIRAGLMLADDNMKLWIMVMLSSGSSRKDAKSMTNRTFFEGTSEYHKKDNFHDALKYLARKNNVVCTCKLIRSKTNKPYYTFLTPECVQKIAKIKLKQEDFDLDAPLLKYSINHVNYKCKQINDVLGLGVVGGYSKFRPHMFRKFHATYLNQGTIGGGFKIEMDYVDMFHGRPKNQTRQTYFKTNPNVYKLEYIKSMNNISLYHKYDWTIVNDKIKIISRSV